MRRFASRNHTTPLALQPRDGVNKWCSHAINDSRNGARGSAQAQAFFKVKRDA
jgi:hypothetical protein